MLRKLKQKKGETLVESLAAILIFTMASIVLFSLVSTAGDINGKAKEMDRQIQEQMVSVEKGDPDDLNGRGTVTMTLNGHILVNEVPIDIYGGKDGSLFAYFVRPDTGGEGD